MSRFALHDLRRVPDSVLADRLRHLRQRPPSDPDAADYAYRKETWAMTANILEAEQRRRRVRHHARRPGSAARLAKAAVLISLAVAVVIVAATTIFGLAGLAAAGAGTGGAWLFGQIRRNQRLTRYLGPRL